MSKPIRHKINTDVNLTTTVTDEKHNSVGASAFRLSELLDQNLAGSGFGHDWFCDLVINDGAGGSGTTLVLNTDYSLSEPLPADHQLVHDIYTATGLTKTVYSKIQIISAAYQACDLYFSYTVCGDDYNCEDINNITIVTDSSLVDGDTIPNMPGKKIYDETTGAARIKASIPLAASNPNLTLEFSKADSGYGCFIPTCQGSDVITINGASMTKLFLKTQYDHVRIFSNGVRWQIVNGFRPYIETGWINTNEWRNRKFGTANLTVASSANFQIGEKVTGGTLGTYGIVIAIPDGTHMNLGWIVSSTTNNVFNHGETLTGSISGATTTLSLPGNVAFKNYNTSLYHGFGVDITKLNRFLTTSPDKAENNKWQIYPFMFYWSANYACISHQTDINNVNFQSGDAGADYLSASGVITGLTTNDYYYNGKVQLL